MLYDLTYMWNLNLSNKQEKEVFKKQPEKKTDGLPGSDKQATDSAQQ